MIKTAGGKYGDRIDKSVWPLRLFEFAESTGYPLADGLHLWDLRVVGGGIGRLEWRVNSITPAIEERGSHAAG